MRTDTLKKTASEFSNVDGIIMRNCIRVHIQWNNNNNIFILYSAKSMYSSKRFTIKRCDIASLKLIRNVKCAINIQYSG